MAFALNRPSGSSLQWAWGEVCGTIYHRVTTCLENLEMSGNLTAVSEMSQDCTKSQGNVREKSCPGKVA